MQVWEQTIVSFCSIIFNSKSYTITDVSVTCKKDIGRWMTVKNRVKKHKITGVPGGDPITHNHTHWDAHICDRMSVDEYGEHAPKVISFIKVCDCHTWGIFLTCWPAIVSELCRILQFSTGEYLTVELFDDAYAKCLFDLDTLL